LFEKKLIFIGDNDGDGQHEYAGGYHLGTMGIDNVVFGSTEDSSYSEMQAILFSLGIISNLSNYYRNTDPHSWYYILTSEIEKQLNIGN